MTGRERELAAISHQETDRIPLDVICIEIPQQIAEYLGIEQDAVNDRLGIDGRIVSAGAYTGSIADTPDFVDRQILTPFATMITGDYGTAHWYPLADASSVSDIERFAWPDPCAYDFKGAAESVAGISDKYALRGPYWLPLFCQVCDLFGMEEAMAKMALEPDIFEAAVEHIHQHNMEYCRSLIQAFGDSMPILCLGDDFATQRGLMISPELWRRFLKPRYAEIFALAKANGKRMWFHSCGDVTSVLPDLIDIGVDVWETVQLHALPMSPRQLKQEFGKDLTFFGAVNTQRLPFISPDEVREEVIHCIDELGRGGGYICGPDHHIKPDVPPINAVTLFDTALTYIRI
ncbi:MAG: uroporphyrinogen decarboxylase family protein [Armatimonadota bacterium]